MEVQLGDRSELSVKEFHEDKGGPHMLLGEPRRGFVIVVNKVEGATGYAVRLIGFGMSAPDGVPIDSGDWERSFMVAGNDPLELLEGIQDAMELTP
jgi:hypothetical protein